MQGGKVFVVYNVYKHSASLFERVKAMMAFALIHLCFVGDSALELCKKYNFTNFFLVHNCLIKQNVSTKPDYNMGEIFPIYL